MITKDKLGGVKMQIGRWTANGGDGRVFSLDVLAPLKCGKHAALESAYFKDGPPTCPERNMKTDKYGREWIDLEKILSELDPSKIECPTCDR